ncbi:hypothetical protein MBLNU230_g6673t1 [Neophaeotheca triangularis]
MPATIPCPLSQQKPIPLRSASSPQPNTHDQDPNIERAHDKVQLSPTFPRRSSARPDSATLPTHLALCKVVLLYLAKTDRRHELGTEPQPILNNPPVGKAEPTFIHNITGPTTLTTDYSTSSLHAGVLYHDTINPSQPLMEESQGTFHLCPDCGARDKVSRKVNLHFCEEGRGSATWSWESPSISLESRQGGPGNECYCGGRGCEECQEFSAYESWGMPEIAEDYEAFLARMKREGWVGEHGEVCGVVGGRVWGEFEESEDEGGVEVDEQDDAGFRGDEGREEVPPTFDLGVLERAREGCGGDVLMGNTEGFAFREAARALEEDVSPGTTSFLLPRERHALASEMYEQMPAAPPPSPVVWALERTGGIGGEGSDSCDDCLLQDRLEQWCQGDTFLLQNDEASEDDASHYDHASNTSGKPAYPTPPASNPVLPSSQPHNLPPPPPNSHNPSAGPRCQCSRITTPGHCQKSSNINPIHSTHASTIGETSKITTWLQQTHQALASPTTSPPTAPPQAEALSTKHTNQQGEWLTPTLLSLERKRKMSTSSSALSSPSLPHFSTPSTKRRSARNHTTRSSVKEHGRRNSQHKDEPLRPPIYALATTRTKPRDSVEEKQERGGA